MKIGELQIDQRAVQEFRDISAGDAGVVGKAANASKNDVDAAVGAPGGFAKFQLKSGGLNAARFGDMAPKTGDRVTLLADRLSMEHPDSVAGQILALVLIQSKPKA
ncbi:MAG: hypothetical protein V2A66_04780 [Pseudomonadota bacterium]